MEVQDWNQFDEIFKQQLESAQGDQRIFTYFYASMDPVTNQSWCPDCNHAQQRVSDYMSKLHRPIVLHCPVGDRTEYKETMGPQHPYKLHPLIQLKRIPTLIEWHTDGRIKKQLIESQCYNKEALDEFFLSE